LSTTRLSGHGHKYGGIRFSPAGGDKRALAEDRGGADVRHDGTVFPLSSYDAGFSLLEPPAAPTPARAVQ